MKNFATRRYAPPPPTSSAGRPTSGPPTTTPPPPASPTSLQLPSPIATLTTTPSTPVPLKDTVMSPAVPQPINGIINMNAGFYMLPGGSDHGSVDRTETLPKTQKKNGAKKIGAYNCKA